MAIPFEYDAEETMRRHAFIPSDSDYECPAMSFESLENEEGVKATVYNGEDKVFDFWISGDQLESLYTIIPYLMYAYDLPTTDEDADDDLP